MKIETPNFTTKAELYDWLVTNKTTLINQKKFEIKKGDAISFALDLDDVERTSTDKSEQIEKAPRSLLIDADKIKVRSIINTTKLMDSHDDVHIDGLWKKTLSEVRLVYLLKEHRMTFENIISDEVTPFTKNVSWASLGAPFEGNTQALIFDSVIEKGRNPYMYEQYVKGYVKNHSVGMRYMKLYLAINEAAYSAEFDAWNKYFPDVANKDLVEEQGYFWAITEAGLIEGSAVVKGSNWVTPTQRVEEEKELEMEEGISKEYSPTPEINIAPEPEPIKNKFYNPNLY